MHELRIRDFCGTDAVGVFEVLPPVLTSVDNQRRVVLYEHCEEALSGVIAPSLSRLGIDADVDMADDTQTETGTSATPERTTNGSGGEATPVDVNTVDTVLTPLEPVDHDSSDEDDNAGSSGGGASNNDGMDDEAEIETEAEARTETRNESSVSAADEQPRPDGEPDRGEEPPKLRGIIRILQDREFPVERVKVEVLASDAYGFDDDEVADIFDYTIERELLIDDSGMFRRP